MDELWMMGLAGAGTLSGLGLWRFSKGPSVRASGDLKIRKVVEDVYIYRGFFSNSAVLVMPEAVALVDTQVSPVAARRLRAQISTVSQKPVTHVFNTHYHGDHTGGNEAFPDAQIIASADTVRLVAERDEERVQYADTFGLAFQDLHPTIPPNQSFSGKMTVTVGGETLEVHQLGRVETPDASVIWWPRRKVVACGDGITTWHYPYLGVPFLDEGLKNDGEWIGYLRQVRAWEPEVLIPGHGPPLIGVSRIQARLDLLIDLYSSLLGEVKTELEKGLPIPEVVERVDTRLAHFRKRPDLQEHTVSQRFAIYRAINSLSPDRRGKGWWEDLRPSVVRRTAVTGPLPDAFSELSGRIEQLLPKDRPSALGLIEAWLTVNPEDAAAWGLYADLLFDGARGVKPAVDATEYIRCANRAARRALALQPEEPLAQLNLGAAEVFGGMVLAQPMDSAIRRLSGALERPLSRSQRQKALFFLGKAHDVEGRQAESDAAWRQLLPGGMGIGLVREWLRAYP